MLSLRQSLATIGTPAPIRIPHDKSIPCKSLRDTLIAWNRIPYALLIIAPQEFIEAVQRLADHKNNTGIRTKILSLEQIYQTYPGRDEAEKVKRCLALFQPNNGVRYAMLVGDGDKFPVRFTKWWNKRSEENLEDFTLYVPVDLYYAALFKKDGSFDDWDGNHNGYFGEIGESANDNSSSAKINLDEVEAFPHLAVGRVPASTLADVQCYVSKAIDYECGTDDSSWAKTVLFVAATDGIGNTCEIQENIVKENFQRSIVNVNLQGFTVHKLYQRELSLRQCLLAPIPQIPRGVPESKRSKSLQQTLLNFKPHPCPKTESLSPESINAYLNQGVGILYHIGHGAPDHWQIPNGDGGYKFSDVDKLVNSPKLPVVLSTGCDTSSFTTLPPLTPYQDIDSKQHDGTWMGEHFHSPDQPVPQPACLQTKDRDSMAESMLVNRNSGGAVAYIGNVITGHASEDLLDFFFNSISAGYKTLGDIWLDMLHKYYASIYQDSTPVVRKFLIPWISSLFGDPSLRVRWLTDFENWGMIPDGVTTDAAVSAVVFKDKLYLFSKGIEDKRIYVDSATDRNHWSGCKEVSGGGTTDVAVSAVVFKDKLYLFSKGIGDQHIYVNSTSDGNSWSGCKEVSGGGTTDAAVSAVVFKDKLYLFSKGIGDQHIYVNSTTDGSSWSGFGHVPNSGTTDSAVSAVAFKNKLYLFSKGIENKRIYVNSTTDGISWSGYKEVPCGGTTDVAIGVAVWDGLRLMAKGIGDKGIYFHRTMDGENWEYFGFQGGPTSTTPVATRLGRNLYVFCVSSLNHRIYCRVLFAVS